MLNRLELRLTGIVDGISLLGMRLLGICFELSGLSYLCWGGFLRVEDLTAGLYRCIIISELLLIFAYNFALKLRGLILIILVDIF